MNNNANEEKLKNFYDLLAFLLRKYGVWILISLILFLSAVSILVHFNAKPGTQVSIIGLISYTKADKIVYSAPADLQTATAGQMQPIEERTDNENANDSDAPSVYFAWKKPARFEKKWLKKAQSFLTKKGFSITHDLDGVFWAQNNNVAVVVGYSESTNQFSVIAASSPYHNKAARECLGNIWREVTGENIY